MTAASMLLMLLAPAVQDPGAPSEPPPPPVRVLVYTTSAGFEHGVVKRPAPTEWSLVETTFARWAMEDPRLVVTVSRNPALFSPRGLAGFDVVFFYTTGELPFGEAGLRALLDWVEAGGGFAGSHCATDTFYKQPEYGRMIGGYFDGHPWHEEVGIRVEDREHPSTKHLGASFRIVDEIYQQRDPWSRERCQVLLSLDTTTTDMEKNGINRDDGDFGIAWVKRYGKGRVFYTGLGHRDSVWQDPRFKQHLVEGILWAAGRSGPPPARP